MRGFHRMGLSFPMLRRTLRLQLALLYAGLFFGLAVVLLAISTGFTAVKSSSSVAAGSSPATDSHSSTQLGIASHTLVVGAAIALGVTVVLSLVLGWLVAGRFLRPLRTMNALAREISATNLNRRLDLGGPGDELTELGQTLDGLFARLEAAFVSQRRFIANAAHELRTPLAAERTLLQVALSDPGSDVATLRSACEEVLLLGQQQEQLIAALLTLASSERGIEVWQVVDLSDITEDVVGAREAEAKRRGIRVNAEFGEARTTGDSLLMESLVTNLVDNAIRHNITGGWVELETSAECGTATISIRNSGSIIPSHEIDRLFQPFQRLQDERVRRGGGHGLGLAIVQAIANAHGATLSARAQPEGGLDITIAFSTPNAAPYDS